MNEKARSLKDPAVREARREMRDQPHVAPLGRLVDEIRREREGFLGFKKEHVPDFDPMDGGIDAKALFLQETPGPRAVESGFISRNNPDSTAENTFNLQNEAGIDRKLTVRWNVVPWYIGDGRHIRPANREDFIQSRKYLETLLMLLGNLRIVALLGNKAQAAWDSAGLACNFKIFRTYHLSPLSLNTSPARREHVRSTFQQIAGHLKGNGSELEITTSA